MLYMPYPASSEASGVELGLASMLQAQMDSAGQPDPPVPSVTVAKPGSWQQSSAAVGRTYADPANAQTVASLPRSPFTSAKPLPCATSARDQFKTLRSLTDTLPIESRHSGGVAADSASSEASQLAAVHTRQIVDLSPEQPTQSRSAAAPQAVHSASQQWGTTALPDGLSGLVHSSKPECMAQPMSSAATQRARGIAPSHQTGPNPTLAVVAAATAALNLAAERLLSAGGQAVQQQQHRHLPQGSAGLAAAAAAAAQLALQGVSPAQAADSIMAMVCCCIILQRTHMVQHQAEDLAQAARPLS